MKISSKLEKVSKFQMGGAAPAPEAATAPAPEQGGQGPEQGGAQDAGNDPMMQILQVAAQAVQSQNCEAAMAVCQGLLDLVAQAQGGAPAEAPQEEPTFARNGAKLVRVK